MLILSILGIHSDEREIIGDNKGLVVYASFVTVSSLHATMATVAF